eukprot:TRINITY_DN6824_c0_g1_i1.p1 TRINITY_DN6824_c0_g1~~TRINITY_DN6824_c0_g1_i1.p1  ORF type:complete len:391 (-),score=112.60 TRINITY_DN6824_c0_g1_i1:242-1324(-)
MDPWRELELQPGADEATIKKSFRRLAKLHHPDRHPEKSPEKMQRLNRAYDALLGTPPQFSTNHQTWQDKRERKDKEEAEKLQRRKKDKRERKDKEEAEKLQRRKKEIHELARKAWASLERYKELLSELDEMKATSEAKRQKKKQAEKTRASFQEKQNEAEKTRASFLEDLSEEFETFLRQVLANVACRQAKLEAEREKKQAEQERLRRIEEEELKRKEAEQERLRRIEEEKELKRKEAEGALKRLKEERLRRIEWERKRKEADEALKRQNEERLRRIEEERAALERLRLIEGELKRREELKVRRTFLASTQAPSFMATKRQATGTHRSSRRAPHQLRRRRLEPSGAAIQRTSRPIRTTRS